MPSHAARLAHAARLTPLAVAAGLLCHAGAARAQALTAELPPVVVVPVGPLPGLGVPKDRVPANVQTVDAADLERVGAPDLASHLWRELGSVTVNETQGNPFQPDVSYRGFTASPLLGTPQGLSVYLDGVRLNQPFGDVVSWDLIPRSALASIALMPGSNPLFGLNTLGGALSVRTKSGLTHRGTSVQALAGSFGRAALEFETGGRRDELHWFVTANRLHERGWRARSPSDLSQLFGKLGWRGAEGDVALTAALADNRLAGNALQEHAALGRDRAGIYTGPDETRNRSVFLNLAVEREVDEDVLFSANAWWRRIDTRTSSADVNEASLTESLWQPSAAERRALAGAGYAGFPTAGENAANTPFPRWRCIANVLLDGEPNEKCNGLVNRTSTQQYDAGLAMQLAARVAAAGLDHRLLAGAAYSASRMHFEQGARFGYLNPDRTVTTVDGPGAVADGTQNSENAFDSRVALSSRSRTWSVYASDTLALGARTHLTLAGRYNRNTVSTDDELSPGGGPGSLDGRHVYGRLNPAAGLTFAATPALTAYAGINQGSRAPSAVELGCADPASPCKLPNAFAGDPPLRQVVTTTVEAGLRGSAAAGRLRWNAGVFRSDNRDDLLFVSDNAAGYGYFRNFGRTRRQGVEAGFTALPAAGWRVGAQLSLLDATFRSAETVDGSGNSSNDAAQAGAPGTEGRIRIEPGDRIPLLPDRVLKLHAQKSFGERWRVGADFAAVAGAPARGNENGRHAPDGVYYSGPGRSAGYGVLNLNVDWRPASAWTLFLRVANVLDRHYASAAQLGANAFGPGGNFVARAFPPNADGERPVPRSTFLAPGAPRAAWVGVRYSFGG